MYLTVTDDELQVLLNAMEREGRKELQDRFLKCRNPPKEHAAYIKAAKESPLVSEGSLEVDDGAPVSKSASSRGAYVMCWLWVSDEIASGNRRSD